MIIICPRRSPARYSSKMLVVWDVWLIPKFSIISTGRMSQIRCYCLCSNRWLWNASAFFLLGADMRDWTLGPGTIFQTLDWSLLHDLYKALKTALPPGLRFCLNAIACSNSCTECCWMFYNSAHDCILWFLRWIYRALFLHLFMLYFVYCFGCVLTAMSHTES